VICGVRLTRYLEARSLSAPIRKVFPIMPDIFVLFVLFIYGFVKLLLEWCRRVYSLFGFVDALSL